MPRVYQRVGVRLPHELSAKLSAVQRQLSTGFPLQRAAVLRTAITRGLDTIESDPSIQPPRATDGPCAAFSVLLDPHSVQRADALAGQLGRFHVSRSEVVRGALAIGLALIELESAAKGAQP